MSPISCELILSREILLCTDERIFITINFFLQGMNEILGPIYYTFATDPDDSWRGTLDRFSLKMFLLFKLIYSLLVYAF